MSQRGRSGKIERGTITTAKSTGRWRLTGPVPSTNYFKPSNPGYALTAPENQRLDPNINLASRTATSRVHRNSCSLPVPQSPDMIPDQYVPSYDTSPSSDISTNTSG